LAIRTEVGWVPFCLAFTDGDAVEAKSGKPLGRFFPELVTALLSLKAKHFVLDGEIVIDVCGAFSFEALQARLHPAASRIRKLSSETPGTLVLFDILAAPGGEVIMEIPLLNRRDALEAFFASPRRPELQLSKFTRNAATAERWLKDAGDGSTDGVVAKLLGDAYRPGERAMIKVRPIASSADFATWPSAAKSALSCLGFTTRRASSTMSASRRPSTTRQGRPSL